MKELQPGYGRSTKGLVVAGSKAGDYLPGSSLNIVIYSRTGVEPVKWHVDDGSRMTRECHVRFCEHLGGKFPGVTRQPACGQVIAGAREMGPKQLQSSASILPV